jgi:hypothetical protein
MSDETTIDEESEPFKRANEWALIIAKKHGILTSELLGRNVTRHLQTARRELYKKLQSQGWSDRAIGMFAGGRRPGDIHYATGGDKKKKEKRTARS